MIEKFLSDLKIRVLIRLSPVPISFVELHQDDLIAIGDRLLALGLSRVKELPEDCEMLFGREKAELGRLAIERLLSEPNHPIRCQSHYNGIKKGKILIHFEDSTDREMKLS